MKRVLLILLTSLLVLSFFACEGKREDPVGELPEHHEQINEIETMPQALQAAETQTSNEKELEKTEKQGEHLTTEAQDNTSSFVLLDELRTENELPIDILD